MAVLPAILVELSFYAAIGFASVRIRLRALSPTAVVALLALSAALPCAIYTVAMQRFNGMAFLAIAALAALAGAWYVLLPKKAIADCAFLIFMAGVLLAGVFRLLYPDAAPRLRLDFLGHLMWIRTGVFSILLFRDPGGIDFGFWPGKRDWKIGIVHYLLFLPVGFIVLWVTGLLDQARAVAPAQATIVAVGTFFGILWVVALSEEFFFRGLLQNWTSRWLSNEIAGLLLASALFGFVHLPYRGFPNWRFATLAAIAGIFYGRAYQQARSIRAAMVVHALAATTWLAFF